MPHSKKQKDLRAKRREKREKNQRIGEQISLETGLRRGTIIRTDRTKMTSNSMMPRFPEYYQDWPFVCRDCKSHEVWTAKQQQRYYEEQGGEIESFAIRCRSCRRKERERKEAARKVHREGMEEKGKTLDPPRTPPDA